MVIMGPWSKAAYRPRLPPLRPSNPKPEPHSIPGHFSGTWNPAGHFLAVGSGAGCHSGESCESRWGRLHVAMAVRKPAVMGRLAGQQILMPAVELTYKADFRYIS